MLIIFVSNLGPLSVISYFMMKITIERLIEMYMMYALCSAMEMWIQLDHNDIFTNTGYKIETLR